MALRGLEPEIVNKLFLAKMVEYVHSGELGKDYEEAKKATEKFGRMPAQQVFVIGAGMSACEDITEKVAEISTAHREELQNATTASAVESNAQEGETPKPWVTLDWPVGPPPCQESRYKRPIEKILNGPLAEDFRSQTIAYTRRHGPTYFEFAEESAMTLTFMFWGSPGLDEG
ncbi:hypothetical protein LTR27_000877 [Elasticomyces elasticus]|nr:hypothetical protein LTR27_000877 [Elasticomyces elasticus]